MRMSWLAEDGFDIITIGIEHEGCVIAFWHNGRRRFAKPRRSIVPSTGTKRCGMKRIDLLAISGGEGCVVMLTRRMELINPEYRVISSIANTIGPYIVRGLKNPTQS